MANFLRMILGVLLLPACWGVTRAFADMLVAAVGAAGGFGFSALALLAGLASFVFAWMLLPHPVRAYVFGHEMTHALWGLLFGARPSNLRVGLRGGSVELTKTNLLITLAPYFFPFYSFVVALLALVVWLFVRPLPYLPLWMFLIGFTWAFHILFTLGTLAERQPDVTLYGRLFSWSFIYLANLVQVLFWLCVMTGVSLASGFSMLATRVASAYGGTFSTLWGVFAFLVRAVRQGG